MLRRDVFRDRPERLLFDTAEAAVAMRRVAGPADHRPRGGCDVSVTGGWLDYWNGDVSLYVCRRHLKAHYAELFRHLAPLLPAEPFTLLDYGCGDALMAPALVERGARVLLFDEAIGRRDALAKTHGGRAGIEVIAGLDALAGGCDVVLLISVIQYVPEAQLHDLLVRLRRLLRPGGRLIVGDVIDPKTGIVEDASALLRFGLGHGFFLKAAAGLLRTAGSSYRRERQRLGLSTYSPDEIAERVRRAGFVPTRLARNIGHATHRHSLVATVPGDA
jgi:SAM-dependent methyltransferase